MILIDKIKFNSNWIKFRLGSHCTTLTSFAGIEPLNILYDLSPATWGRILEGEDCRPLSFLWVKAGGKPWGGRTATGRWILGCFCWGASRIL